MIFVGSRNCCLIKTRRTKFS